MSDRLGPELREALARHDGFATTGDGALRILDVACGDGSFTQTLHESVPRYELLIGIDVDGSLLEEAEDRFADAYVGREPPVRFVSGDARAIPFLPKAFHLSAISNGLHHVANVPAALSEMARVTRPGGMIVVHEMVSDGLSEAQQVARDVHHFKARVDRAFGISHRPTYSRAEMDSLLGAMDAEVLDQWEYLPADDRNGSQERTEEQTEERVEERVEFVETYTELAEALPIYPAVRKEATRLIHRLRSVGFAYPPQRVVILRNHRFGRPTGGNAPGKRGHVGKAPAVDPGTGEAE